MLLLDKNQSEEILPRLRRLFDGHEKVEGICRSLVTLSLGYQQRLDLDEATQALYVETLLDLTPEELALAFTRAQRESAKFFPSPAELLALVGLETSHQRSNREGLEALSFVIKRIRRHGISGAPRHGMKIRDAGRDSNGAWHPEEFEEIPAPHVSERIQRALEELGEGDIKAGVRQCARHPILQSETEERQSLGLEMAAIEKFERRWLDAWRRAAKEEL